MESKVRIARKNAIGMSELVEEFIREMKISSGLNNRRIFEAWLRVSGAGKYTIKQFFRAGTLYVTLNSSTARSHYNFQLDGILLKMNAILEEDPLFTKDDPNVSSVNKIVLK